MPQIPGVADNAANASRGLDTPQLAQIGGGAALLLTVVLAFFWWGRNKPRANAELTPPTPEAAQAADPPPRAAPTPAPTRDQTNVAATTDELSRPWAWKQFVFVKPYTNEKVNAAVMRLPAGELWAFSLQEPYGRCELEFVTDLEKLATQYGYRAQHPMIGNPCNGTVYDPLKVGPLGGDTWARGEIVKGSGLRPPFSIEVKVSGNSVVADRME